MIERQSKKKRIYSRRQTILLAILCACLLLAVSTMALLYMHDKQADTGSLHISKYADIANDPRRTEFIIDNNSNYRLTHIVIPFYEKQLNNVLENFDEWDTYKPCSQEQAEVDLVYFISRDDNFALIENTILRRASQSTWATECFKSIDVVSANMTAAEDSYWYGSRVQFEKFLKLHFLSRPSVVRYVMYMEPDCHLLRSDWLPSLQSIALEKNIGIEDDVFFIKGHRSMPRYQAIQDHINGNALYNLGDARLSHFYFHIYGPHLKADPLAGNATRWHHLAYDMDIHKFLDETSSVNIAVRHIRDRTISSEFLQNFYHRDYTIRDVTEKYPTAIMVHGGYRQEEEDMLLTQNQQVLSPNAQVVTKYREVVNDPRLTEFIIDDNSPYRLTHIVVPFYEGQLKHVLRNFDEWDIYKPCTQDQAAVDLVYFISRDVNIAAIKSTILRRVSQSTWATECFRSIDVVSANMTAAEDSYWYGSRVQFEKFLKLHFLSRPSVVRYVMYMEPDCYFFRSDWLLLMQKAAWEKNIGIEDDVFFIKGHRSMPRFNLTYNHINGNALYNLGDARLSHFYFHIYGPYLKADPLAGNATKWHHLAYDMDIHNFLDETSSFNIACRHIRNRTISSEFLQNFFHMDYTISDVATKYPTAIMVHGGYRQEEEDMLLTQNQQVLSPNAQVVTKYREVVNDPRLTEFIIDDDSPYRLTHIVIPFYEGQLKHVLRNFDEWDTYKPCSQEQAEVDLVYFISRDVNIAAIKSTILRRASQSTWATECFKSIDVVSANMTAAEDSYWYGSRVQFEKFLKLHFLSRPSVVRYVMYMEPDCYFFRSDWLPSLQSIALEKNIGIEDDVFFIKGHRSMPRFNLTYNHINGNALYNLGDARLSHFYFHIYGPHLKADPLAGNATKWHHLAYDMDIHNFLDATFRVNIAVRHIRDRTISSEFLQNFFHLKYFINDIIEKYPTAIMVHGGYRQEEGLWGRLSRFMKYLCVFFSWSTSGVSTAGNLR